MSGRGRSTSSSGGGAGGGGSAGGRGGRSGSVRSSSGGGGNSSGGVRRSGSGNGGGVSQGQGGRGDRGGQPPPPPPPNNMNRSGRTGDRGGATGGGGGGGSGGSSRRQRSRGGGGGGGRGPSAEQTRKLELERKRKEDEEKKAAEAAAKAAALAEEEKKRRAEIAAESVRRRVLQTQYEQSVQNAITSLESFVMASKRRSDIRASLSPHVLPSSTDPTSTSSTTISPLQTSRNTFEQSKKNLKSDLKKCTAFVKRIKAGQYPTPSELELPNNAIKTLNLTRYVEEVAAALMEPTTKVKQGDVPGIVMLCVEMHRRYPTFAETLIPSLLSVISSGSSGNSSSGGGDGDGEGGLPRRTCFRLLIEFILHGIVTDMKPLMKLIHEASGVPSDESKDYAVTDANMIVTLAKVGGHEILGVVPKSVKKDMEKLVLELGGRGEGNLVFTSDEASSIAAAGTPVEGANASGETTTTVAATAKDGCDNSQRQDSKSPSSSTAAKPSNQEAIDLQIPFVVTLSIELQHKIQSTLDVFNSTIPYSRAVPLSTSTLLHKHTLGAYRTLSDSYVSTNRRLLKLAKRCEQDRLLQGTLSDSREKGLADARSLMESLTKSVESLAESLDITVPMLESAEAINAESSDGKGIELWSGGNETDGSDENLGPFDDEETRRFYCNLPDLLSTKPPALLGISASDFSKMKERNLRVYGEHGGEEEDEEEDEEIDLAAIEDMGDDAIMDETEEGDDNDEEADDAAGDGEKDGKENKDSPGYRLNTLLEQDLPEATRRETIDELAERFCVNHGSNKNSRKRLYKTLFLVPRTRLDLLAYYSRFATILDQVYSDSTLVSELEAQMHGQAKFKNANLESRLRTVRYLGELTKFRVAPPMVILRGLRRCLEDFSGCNIEVACCILESCGRYLYRMKHTHSRIQALMETMMRMKKAKNLDERQVAMITSAFLMVNPPAQNSRPQKEVPPLELYLRDLLLTRLEPNDKSVSFVSKQIQRMPWSDPGIDCGALVTKYMLKACRRGRYKATKAIAALAVNLKRSKPEVTARLIDDVLEEIQWFICHPSFRDHQRTLVCARLLGELYCEGAIPSSILFDEVHHIINFGHDIPDALRQASVNQKLFLPRGNVSKTIHEDEEMEDEENEEQDNEMEKNQQPVVIPVSLYSKYDPRVPCDIDPPMAAFRIKLVCTILETASKHIVSASNKTKLEFCLALLQRYLFTKKMLPTDVEFSILDLFDTLDSYLKKSSPVGGKSKKAMTAAALTTLVRYNSWLDAHEYVLAAERNKRLDEARDRARVLAQAGLLGAGVGDLLDEDESSTVISEDEESEKGGNEGESDDDSAAESFAEGDIADELGSESSSSSGDDDLSDYEEEDDINDADAEAAYLKQLQDEEFESELRKLTLEALEKGKVIARTGAGGKVSSQMPAAPQFIAKKPAGDQIHHLPEGESSTASPFVDEEGMPFKLLKRGNKGKQEEVQLFVPKNTNLARRATKQDDAAAKERDLLKARVLQYEAESADAGGNVYLDETKLQVIRNRPLTIETIDRNFGKSTETPYELSQRLRGPSRQSPGRGRGGGRLFNPGGRR